MQRHGLHAQTRRGAHVAPARSARGGRRAVTVTATLLREPAPAASASVTDDEDALRERRDASQDAGPRPTQRRVRNAGPVTVAMLKDVRTMFHSVLTEMAYWVQDSWVSGTIPPELCGTYFRNGPGLMVANPRYQRHTLDGDGMVFSLAFKDGRAYFRNRFVRTKGFLREQEVGRPVYRNSFTRGAADGSLHWNPFDLNFKNVANTGVLPWGGKLYALWEAGLPYLLDPTSLATLRESRMGGAIRGSTFAAHYRIVTEPAAPQPEPAAAQPAAQPATAATQAAAAAPGSRRRLVTFSNEFGFGGATAVFYEFDEAGGLLHATEHKLEGVDVAIIHDMVVTEHYYVLLVGPIRLQPAKFATQYLLGRCSIAECLVFDEAAPTRIMLFPRPGRPGAKAAVPPPAPRVLTCEPCFIFHNVNGWEEGGGRRLVVDAVAWERVDFDMQLYDKHSQRTDGFVGGARTQLTRLEVDLASGAVTQRRLLRRTVEFPATDPRTTGRRHRVGWFIADAYDDPLLWGPAQSIVRLEMEAGAGAGAGAEAGAEADAGAGAEAEAGAGPQQLAPPLRARGGVAGVEGGVAGGMRVDEWFLGHRTFPGEPMFVPRPGSSREGDGWLIVGVHNADSERGDVHIFDAEDLSAGPLATLHLPHRLPVSLHGAWEAVYRGPDPGDAAVPRWQELGRVRPL